MRHRPLPSLNVSNHDPSPQVLVCHQNKPEFPELFFIFLVIEHWLNKKPITTIIKNGAIKFSNLEEFISNYNNEIKQ